MHKRGGEWQTNGGSSISIPKKTHTEKIMNVDITYNKGNVSTKSLKVKDFVEDKINKKKIGYKYPSLKSKTEKRKLQEVNNIFKDPKRGICPVIDNKK